MHLVGQERGCDTEGQLLRINMYFSQYVLSTELPLVHLSSFSLYAYR